VSGGKNITIRRNTGFSIHLMTASGAVAGFMALEAVFDGRIRVALIWLVVCQILDGIDGPIARKLDVRVHASRVDGHVLDLVVDYVTCVVVPAVLLVQLELAPQRLSAALVAAILITSALWFARVDQETPDGWFRGFPAMWNIVVPTFVILGTDPVMVAVVCTLGCVLQLSNLEFPHILRATAMRRLTVSFAAVHFAAFVVLSATYPRGDRLLRDALLVAPVYLAAIVIWRTFFPQRTIFGRRIAPLVPSVREGSGS